MIFVACPFAAVANASNAFSFITSSEAFASRRSLMPSAVAVCTFKIASASPSASKICDCFFASARRTADSLSPSAIRIGICFSRIIIFICHGIYHYNFISAN